MIQKIIIVKHLSLIPSGYNKINQLKEKQLKTISLFPISLNQICKFPTPNNSILYGNQMHVLHLIQFQQYREIVLTPQIKGSVQECSPPSDANSKQSIPSYPHFCPTWLQIKGSHEPLLKSCCNSSKNPEKHFTYVY